VGRRLHGSQAVVFVDDRDPEHGHHGVADELLDRAAVALQLVAHLGEVAGDHPPQGLRIHLLAQRRGAGEIAEDHGDGLTFFAGAFGLCGGLGGRGDRWGSHQCVPARLTEAGAVGIVLSALRTDGHHR
jgi:hypothetical protein